MTQQHEQTINLLISSINDIQNTIRSFDNKIIAVTVILSLPLTKILTILKSFSTHPFIVIIILLTWGIGYTACLQVLLSIDNPNKHIKGDTPLGIFYSGGLFKIELLKSMFSKSTISKTSYKEHRKKFNLETKEIIDELVFEQMKLAYIRDLKSKRQQLAIFTTLLWMLCGLYLITVTKVI